MVLMTLMVLLGLGCGPQRLRWSSTVATCPMVLALLPSQSTKAVTPGPALSPWPARSRCWRPCGSRRTRADAGSDRTGTLPRRDGRPSCATPSSSRIWSAPRTSAGPSGMHRDLALAHATSLPRVGSSADRSVVQAPIICSAATASRCTHAAAPSRTSGASWARPPRARRRCHVPRDARARHRLRRARRSSARQQRRARVASALEVRRHGRELVISKAARCPMAAPSEPTVEAEQRHRVVDGKGVARHPVDVRAVGGIELGGLERLGEQAAVQPLRTTAAELVVLQLGEGDLRGTVEARDRPGVRIALLEVVEAALHQELEVLVRAGVAPEEVRERDAGVIRRDRDQLVGHRVLLVGKLDDRAAVRPELGLELRLQARAYGEQGRVPLSASSTSSKPR